MLGGRIQRRAGRRPGRPHRGPAGQRGDHRRRQHRARRGRRRVGRRGRHAARRTASAGWNACRASRVGRGDAGAERRRVRRRGGRHDPPGAAAGPRHRRGLRWVAGAELGFGYRTSILKHSDAAHRAGGGVRAGRRRPQRAAALRRTDGGAGRRAGSATDPAAVRDAVLALRRRKGMVLDAADHDTWSVGSFFTNPVVTRGRSTGCQAAVDRTGAATTRRRTASSWPRAGWWSMPASARAIRATARPARLSTKHALALTNRGTATTADVIALARAVRDGCRSRHSGSNSHPSRF